MAGVQSDSKRLTLRPSQRSTSREGRLLTRQLRRAEEDEVYRARYLQCQRDLEDRALLCDMEKEELKREYQRRKDEGLRALEEIHQATLQERRDKIDQLTVSLERMTEQLRKAEAEAASYLRSLTACQATQGPGTSPAAFFAQWQPPIPSLSSTSTSTRSRSRTRGAR